MKKFCQQCGHELNSLDQVCTNCGIPLSVKKPIKKAMTKKQKIGSSIIVGLLVIAIGFSVWATNYFSSKSTLERFSEAISDKSVKQIVSLAVHEDGAPIQKQEAKALLTLVKSEGKEVIEPYVAVQQSEKFLGVFQKHEITLIDQFVYIDSQFEGLGFTFNDLKPNAVQEENITIFGPFIPGVYEVSAILKNDFGTSSSEQEVYLVDENSEPVWIDSDLPVATTVFSVENYNHLVMKDATVLIQDKKIEVNNEGETASVGPLLLDGNLKANLVTPFPWGETTSESYIIDSEYILLKSSIVSEEERKNISSTLVKFGEEQAASTAAKSASKLTTVTTNFKKQFQDQVLDELNDTEIYYSGRLDQLDIDWDSLDLYDEVSLGVSVKVAFNYSESIYSIEETPDLEPVIYSESVYLIYNQKTKNWSIHKTENTWDDINTTESVMGSETIYAPSNEVINTTKLASIKGEIQTFMEDYTYYSVAAINNRDMSYVDSYMSEDGPRKKEAADYISYLEEKGITEEFLSTEVTNVIDKGNDMYEITSIEAFTIYTPDSEKDKKFSTVSIVKKVDGQWYMHQMVSTKEL